jgi:hypothetical protein
MMDLDSFLVSWYSGRNRLQVLHTLGYQSVEIQVDWMLAVMHRRGGA